MWELVKELREELKFIQEVNTECSVLQSQMKTLHKTVEEVLHRTSRSQSDFVRECEALQGSIKGLSEELDDTQWISAQKSDLGTLKMKIEELQPQVNWLPEIKGLLTRSNLKIASLETEILKIKQDQASLSELEFLVQLSMTSLNPSANSSSFGVQKAQFTVPLSAKIDSPKWEGNQGQCDFEGSKSDSQEQLFEAHDTMEALCSELTATWQERLHYHHHSSQNIRSWSPRSMKDVHLLGRKFSGKQETEGDRILGSSYQNLKSLARGCQSNN